MYHHRNKFRGENDHSTEYEQELKMLIVKQQKERYKRPSLCDIRLPDNFASPNSNQNSLSGHSLDKQSYQDVCAKVRFRMQDKQRDWVNGQKVGRCRSSSSVDPIRHDNSFIEQSLDRNKSTGLPQICKDEVRPKSVGSEVIPHRVSHVRNENISKNMQWIKKTYLKKKKSVDSDRNNESLNTSGFIMSNVLYMAETEKFPSVHEKERFKKVQKDGVSTHSSPSTTSVSTKLRNRASPPLRSISSNVMQNDDDSTETQISINVSETRISKLNASSLLLYPDINLESMLYPKTRTCFLCPPDKRYYIQEKENVELCPKKGTAPLEAMHEAHLGSYMRHIKAAMSIQKRSNAIKAAHQWPQQDTPKIKTESQKTTPELTIGNKQNREEKKSPQKSEKTSEALSKTSAAVSKISQTTIENVHFDTEELVASELDSYQSELFHGLPNSLVPLVPYLYNDSSLFGILSNECYVFLPFSAALVESLPSVPPLQKPTDNLSYRRIIQNPARINR